MHGTLGRPADLDSTCVTYLVSQDREVVPERRDEAAITSARAVAGETSVQHDDVERRLELLQLPGRPEAEVAGADDDHVGRRVAGQWRRRLDRPRLLEPVAVARVPHAGDPTTAHLTDVGSYLSGLWRAGRRQSLACCVGSNPGVRLKPDTETGWRTGLEPATTGITTRGSTN